MNETTIAPRLYFVHGDLAEDYQPSKWADPVTGYVCQCCDLIRDAEHFKQHSREQHLARYRHSLKVLANIASWEPVQRGGDCDTNLIERGFSAEIDRERQAPDTVQQPGRAVAA